MLVGVVLVGCDRRNVKKHPYQTLVFKVDETLLEPSVTDTTLRIKMGAPKGWKKLDASTFAQVTHTLELRLLPEIEMAPQWIFLNESSGATCIVSRLTDLTITPSETLLKDVMTAYQERFPKATVQQAVFMKGAFRIHQLMVVATDAVRIKLICDAPETPVFTVDYNVPKDVYRVDLRAIESSIGSINLIHE